MKKVLLPLFFIFFTVQISAQFSDRLTNLPKEDMKKYATPLATWAGTYFNSGGYYSADVSKVFGFKLSLVGMMIFIPEDQTTFKLKDGTKSATFFGDKGAAIPGSEGYAVYPPGINQTSIPAGIPQIAFSTLGTELLVRYFPKIDVSDVTAGLLGLGLKHNISQYFISLPVDIAVQFLYNSFTLESTDVDMSTSNIAFNAHASRSFGLFTLYGGLQYESTSMDIDYIYSGTGFEGVEDGEQIKLSLDGDNNFRLTLGAALRLGLLVINTDVNFGSQIAVVAGLNFEF